MERRCPDCGVGMEPVTLGVDLPNQVGGASGLFVKTDERREGVLGKLGLRAKQPVEPSLCPECGRVRLYADVDGDGQTPP